jgi:hypothetical protein
VLAALDQLAKFKVSAVLGPRGLDGDVAGVPFCAVPSLKREHGRRPSRLFPRA